MVLETTTLRKATVEDIESIYEIISSYSTKGILLARTLDDISFLLEHFFIADINNVIVGVISYYDYGDHLKEIRSLAVRQTHLRRGIGSALLRYELRELTAANNPKIFVLTYTPAFFEKNGFTIIDKNMLPEKIWKDCMFCKNWDVCNETALEYTA